VQPIWEEAHACGVCGATRWAHVRAICGKRYGRCAACGVVRLVDRLAEGSLPLLYDGYYAESELSDVALALQLENPTFASRRARLEASLGARARRIFEIGCGDGNFLAFLRAGGWQVDGLEYSPATVAIIRKRHGFDVVTGDIAAAGPAPGPFPVVAAYHVLEHVYHPARWLQALHGLLEPDGLLHLQVPNYASWTRRLSGVAWTSWHFPQHVYFYTPETLSRFLETNGFEATHLSTWDPWHGPGTVESSIVNMMRRRNPWNDDVLRTPRSNRVELTAACLPGARRFARSTLKTLSAAAARLEAAIGRGVVVDILARRAPLPRD
jgi:SAM-dependent methyltransferase